MSENTYFDENLLVKELINNFTAKGLDITHANYGGYPKPEEMKNHRPDIVGWDFEKQLCYVGTSTADVDKLLQVKTGEQFFELSNLVMSKGQSEGKPCPFYIAVPKKHQALLEQKLVDLGLSKRKNVQILGV